MNGKPVHYWEVTWLDVLHKERLWGEVPEWQHALDSCKIHAFKFH